MVKISVLKDKIKNSGAWLWEQQETLNAMQQTGQQIALAMNKRREQLQNDRIALAKLERTEKAKKKKDEE